MERIHTSETPFEDNKAIFHQLAFAIAATTTNVEQMKCESSQLAYRNRAGFARLLSRPQILS